MSYGFRVDVRGDYALFSHKQYFCIFVAQAQAVYFLLILVLLFDHYDYRLSNQQGIFQQKVNMV